jgi:hypothetical protein
MKTSLPLSPQSSLWARCCGNCICAFSKPILTRVIPSLSTFSLSTFSAASSLRNPEEVNACVLPEIAEQGGYDQSGDSASDHKSKTMKPHIHSTKTRNAALHRSRCCQPGTSATSLLYNKPLESCIISVEKLLCFTFTRTTAILVHGFLFAKFFHC